MKQLCEYCDKEHDLRLACLEYKNFMAIDEFHRIVFRQNVFTNEMADKIIRDNLNYFKNLPKPTRKQRLKWWWQDKVQRAKDIWTILSGGDVHKDCGY
jgi:trehalose/maltose hydrolase-like predicted phosphorylase